jgi:hypothetical protein
LLEERQRLDDQIKAIQNAKMRSELEKELRGQKGNYQEVMKFLKAKLKHFFAKIRPEERELSADEIYGCSVFLIQHCLYPRLMMSPADALYSINFLKLLVEF